MSAHFAPPFFSYLLGKCLKRQNPLFEVLKLGLVVIGAFSLVWWPYMQSANAFLEVLSRLAPFERGICEDYVTNFWCTTSVLVKWKRLFTIPSLKLLSFGATISASLSLMIQQIWAPSKQGFLYGRLNTSLSFYMFSYQVHEKSILLPLLPSSFLVMEEPFLFKQMMHYSLLSMFPLLCRDELIFPYLSLSALLILLYLAAGRRQDTTERNSPANLRSFMIGFLVLCSLNINAVYLAMRIPKKYPFLFEAMIMLLCFSQFVFVDGYTPT